MKLTGLSRVSKTAIIRDFQKELEQHSTLFLTNHAGVSASSIDKLRAKLRKEKTRYVVFKNRLGRQALAKTQFKNLSDQFKGACGVAFSGGDPVGTSKVLVEFAKE